MTLIEKICTAGAVLCLLYYLAIVIHAGITADFAWIWILFAALLGGIRLLVQFARSHPGVIPLWLLCLGGGTFLVGMLVFGIFTVQIVKDMFAEPEPHLDYVIVLGAQVKGEVPSRALRKRLDCALEYASENPETILILSGGKGSGEDITEAECMYRYLTEAGLSPERLLQEERSTSTLENLKFSKELCPEAGIARTGILSNNFHISRALMLARNCGYTQICGIPAHSDVWMQPHYIVREVCAMAAYKLLL